MKRVEAVTTNWVLRKHLGAFSVYYLNSYCLEDETKGRLPQRGTVLVHGKQGAGTEAADVGVDAEGRPRRRAVDRTGPQGTARVRAGCRDLGRGLQTGII